MTHRFFSIVMAACQVVYALPVALLLSACDGTTCGDATYGLIQRDGKVAPFDESAAAFRSAISMARHFRSVGRFTVHAKTPSNDELPRLLVCYGQFLVRNRHPEDALKQFDDAIALADRTTNVGQSTYARALDGKASALLMLSRFAEALPVAQRSIKAQLSASGASSSAYGEALGLTGDVYYQLGRLSDAECCYRSSLAVFSAAKGADSPAVIAAERAVGECLRQQGREDEARPYLRRAFAQLHLNYKNKHNKFKLY